jgi:hypothetical protein
MVKAIVKARRSCYIAGIVALAAPGCGSLQSESPDSLQRETHAARFVVKLGKVLAISCSHPRSARANSSCVARVGGMANPLVLRCNDDRCWADL